MVDCDRDRDPFFELESPAMVKAGRAEFERWLNRWDHLRDGLPSDEDVGELLCSVFSAMRGINPTLSR
jgi:hypothetical protein